VKNLRTNLDNGLTPVDIEDRRRHFGTNRKDPPTRTPYWEFFIKAIDDFMLKLLLVCACVDIGFGVGFAEPHDRSHGRSRHFPRLNKIYVLAAPTFNKVSCYFSISCIFEFVPNY